MLLCSSNYLKMTHCVGGGSALADENPGQRWGGLGCWALAGGWVTFSLLHREDEVVSGNGN